MSSTLLAVGALVASIGALPATAPKFALDQLKARNAPNTFAQLGDCPGYKAANVTTTEDSLTAQLSLAGEACDAYGKDLESLTLTVTPDTLNRLHVKIEDAGEQAYQVPTSVFPRPESAGTNLADAELQFKYTESPFSFNVTDRTSGEVVFDSSAASLVFEDQYLRLRTRLPVDPNLYGLAEHSDQLRLNTTNYTRTFWSKDAYALPENGNLYSNHPVYFDHRGSKGSYGVFMLSSSGMDIKINRTESEGQYLEYNILGGVLDMYFVAGKTPAGVSREYAKIAGTPAMHQYWSLGFHSCRYGYRDFYAVAETITNYSAAGIPLETQWTDIDYMKDRWVFTLDPDRYPLPRMRDIVNYLHEHNQQYIVMVDPAVAYQDYSAFNRGVEQDVFMKYDNGTIYKGVVWPGVTAFPDWFHPNAQSYWDTEFTEFFSVDSGVDIDGLWIDMNEASNFCPWPCSDPEGFASTNHFPPARPFVRSQPRPIPGFPPEFQPGASSAPPDSATYNDPSLAPAASPGQRVRRDGISMSRRQLSDFSAPLDTPVGLPNRNLIAPPYRIDNDGTYFEEGGLSNFTIRTDLHHYHGLADLDVHNVYGTMMSQVSRGAMLARKALLRPLIITRSTFAGAGRNVGKWLGDNASTWDHYRNQIQGMLTFSAISQVPMVGSDVCGFGGNTTESLCARWAMLGAFNPFYRNHNQDTGLPQEFYQWKSVREAAKKAIDIRYRLLDYFYTALYEQTVDGTPSISPMFFAYPEDTNTFPIELQFFYGNSVLVSPVTDENATSVEIYLPMDRFYDFYTFVPMEGKGEKFTISDQGLTDLPLHIKGGSILAMRNESAMTTTEVRTKPFDLVVAPDLAGKAQGTLYLDDGKSIEQTGITYVKFSYETGKLEAEGRFDYTAERNSVSRVTVLGQEKKPSAVNVNGKDVDAGSVGFDDKSGVVTIDVELDIAAPFTVQWT